MQTEAERNALEKKLARELANAEIARKREARQEQRERELAALRYEHENVVDSIEGRQAVS